MATSRRRERELARRRFERRRQAELERRAKAKKRNTVIGAVVGTIVVVGALVGGGFAVFGHSNKPKTSALKPVATPTPAASSTAPAAPAPTKCAKIAPNPPAAGQQKVPDVTGKVSKKLVIHDIKVGHGMAAKDGDNMQVYYTGVSCTTGKVFDASYLHKPLATLPIMNLGQASVIEGFNKGLVGMRAGGIRELVIPASEAYASQPASAPTGANDTLIFLITAKSVSA